MPSPSPNPPSKPSPPSSEMSRRYAAAMGWGRKRAQKLTRALQAKAKLPTLKAGLDEAAAKLNLAKDADQGAAKSKEVIDLLRNTHAKQTQLKTTICGRIVNEKGTV